MIQRVQTIFLFLAAAAGFGLLGVPFATTVVTVESSQLFSDAIYNVNDNIALLILFVVAGSLCLASIFLYRNRSLQMKLTRFAIIANVIGLILAIFLFWQDVANMGSAEVRDGIGAYMPLGFLIFGLLALRYIGRDEHLVKSMDRLR